VVRDYKLTLLYLAGFWAVFVGAIVLVNVHWIFLLLAWPVTGIVQHNIAFIGHDLSHNAGFDDHPKFAKIIGQWLIFAPLFIDMEGYKRWHVNHHKNVNTKDDPEYRLKLVAKAKYTPPLTERQKLGIAARDLIGAGWLEVLSFIKATSLRADGSLGWAYVKAGLRFSLFWGLVAAVFGINVLFTAELIWIVSIFTTFWASFRLRIYREHFGLDALARAISKRDELLGDHTHRDPWPTWLRLITVWHGQYHWEHHEKPGVPFHQLSTIKIA